MVTYDISPVTKLLQYKWDINGGGNEGAKSGISKRIL